MKDLVILQFREEREKQLGAARFRQFHLRHGDRRREKNRIDQINSRKSKNLPSLLNRLALYSKSKEERQLAVRKRQEKRKYIASLKKKEEDHQKEYKEQQRKYLKALRKFSGEIGWKQGGYRCDRIRREDRFRDAVIDRITRVTQTKTKIGHSRWHPNEIVADLNAELNTDIKKRVAEAVKKALSLKNEEFKIFFSKYNKLLAQYTSVEGLIEGGQDIVSAMNFLFRTPDEAFHTYFSETKETKQPHKFYLKAKVDENKEPILDSEGNVQMERDKIPCTEERCSKTLPENWQHRLCKLLRNLERVKSDPYKCMESVLDFESCDGCVENTNLCEFACREEDAGCEDGLRLLTKLAPHSNKVRNVRRELYKCRRAIVSICEIDELFENASTDLKQIEETVESLKNKDSHSLEAVGSKGSKFPGPEMNEKAIADKWETHINAFKEVEQDHPLIACRLCDELKNSSKFPAKDKQYGVWPSQMNQSDRDRAAQVIWANFPELDISKISEIKALYPMKICTHCWDCVRAGVIGGGMRANKMHVDEVPKELASLNRYETFLISRYHVFYTITSLKPLGGKNNLPKHLLLKATKGSAVHLPIPVANTTTKVLDTLPMANPEEVMKIYADVPTKSGVTWRNLINVDRVLSALKWLKANNSLYSDIKIDPNVFQQMNDRGFLMLTGIERASRFSCWVFAGAP